MKVAKDITGLSLPFAAGIAAGSLISGALAPRGPLLWLLSGGACLVCAFLLGLSMSRKTDSWRRLLLLYLASGFFCSSAASVPIRRRRIDVTLMMIPISWIM